MSNIIRSYNELLIEKQKLQSLLAAQRELISYDIQDLKAEFKPALDAVSLLGKVTTRDSSNPLFNIATNSLVDLLLKKIVLSRSGWLSRLAIPFFVKNISSHFIADHKDEIMNKLHSFIGHTNGKEKQPAHN
jgi:hypothetical protein